MNSAEEKKQGQQNIGNSDGAPLEVCMTSQLPALYEKSKSRTYFDEYMRRLMGIGFRGNDAEKMFRFEYEIIQKFGKPQLLHPLYTLTWVMKLQRPLFQGYPKAKEEILRERFLTMSEICKIIDEAEWHYWNSHERDLSDAVWEEIYAWRLRGAGGEFACSYFEMIQRETGIPQINISMLSSMQGMHLRQYKWRPMR